ncbi:MAG: Uma2 family endonuclease [Planctomycetales bacterium]|nr:Uma2 family endonuclease [Planctomycetales bacterium]
MPSLSIGLSALLTDLATCLNWYRLASPGLYCCIHPTLELPDNHVVVPGVVLMANHGKHRHASPEPNFERFRGAPNFVADVFSSDTSLDYSDRKHRFAAAGIEEYLAVFDTEPLSWEWNVLNQAEFNLLKPQQDGIIRSSALPGLWFPEVAFAGRDWWTLMAAITRGVTRRGHHEFMHSIWHANQIE